MKKKIIYSIAVLAVAALAAVNVSVNTREEEGLSDILIENINALADGEGSGNIPCRQNKDNLDESCSIYVEGIYCPCGW
jgi:hypothetical protein